MLCVVLIVCCLVGACSQLTVDEVTCNSRTPVCECRSGVDVCEFKMNIELLQTFTRYEVNGNGDIHGMIGHVWYINSTTGEFYPDDPNSNLELCANMKIDDPRCTEPFVVDGYTFRSFISVNGRIPGPTLIVNQGQLVKATVSNRLVSETITIHWHGMHQRGSNWMDGVERVTQCGIQPGTSFTYIFIAYPSGTHWYHSHSGTQRSDGLFGALIVREKQQLTNDVINKLGQFVDAPGEHTLLFLDWKKLSSADFYTRLSSGIKYFKSGPNCVLAPDEAFIGPVAYWSGLINGRGRHQFIDYNRTRLSVFTVSPSTTYRFRLIGAQSLYAYRVSVDEHKLNVIATDGVFIEPVEVDYIFIESGERYDFLLNTKSSLELNGKYNFMIRAEVLLADPRLEITSFRVSNSDTAEAILHYKLTNEDNEPLSTQYKSIKNQSVPVIQQCTVNKPCNALSCPIKSYPESYNMNCIHIHQLRLLYPFMESDDDLPDLDVSDNNRLLLNFGFDGPQEFISSINARSTKLPSTPPALLDEEQLNDIKEHEFCKNLDNPGTCDNKEVSSECSCTHVKNVNANSSIQLVLAAVRARPNFLLSHPVHFHGHYFHVVDIQFGEYDSKGTLISANSNISCSGTNYCTVPQWSGTPYGTGRGKVNVRAPLRDTLVVPAGGYAVVYFKTNNPGWWFLHCHMEQHQLEGMSMVINELGNKIPAPYFMDKSCGNFNFTTDQFNLAVENSLNPSSTPSSSIISSSLTTLQSIWIGISIGVITGIVIGGTAVMLCAVIYIHYCSVKKKDQMEVQLDSDF